MLTLTGFVGLLVGAVPTASAGPAWEPANTSAVIVGVLKYQDRKMGGFSQKDRKDRELRDMFLKRGVPADNIALLLDEEATLPRIGAALVVAASKAKPGSTLIFYYAGHGLRVGPDDVTLANYEMVRGMPGQTGLRTSTVAQLIRQYFRGGRVLFMADCCHAGGLGLAAKTLHQAGIPAASLTSSDLCATSTGNWTFTQTVLDSLRGDALADRNGDGAITLEEIAAEVMDAMKHREKQRADYVAYGVPAGARMASTDPASRQHHDVKGPFALRDYVVTGQGRRSQAGRIVGQKDGKYLVRFTAYTNRQVKELPAGDLKKMTFAAYKVGDTLQVLWRRQPYKCKVLQQCDGFHLVRYEGWAAEWDEWVLADRILGTGDKVPETVQVQWQGEWWAAVILKTEKEKYLIHYPGWGDEWDEWVTKERIRFRKDQK